MGTKDVMSTEWIAEQMMAAEVVLTAYQRAGGAELTGVSVGPHRISLQASDQAASDTGRSLGLDLDPTIDRYPVWEGSVMGVPTQVVHYIKPTPDAA